MKVELFPPGNLLRGETGRPDDDPWGACSFPIADQFDHSQVENNGAETVRNFFVGKETGFPWYKKRRVKLVLVGTVSNRSAIGAKVRVKTTIGGKTFWQLREVSGSANYNSFQDMRPNFGLGQAAVAETVRIEWPSGIVQELHNVTANQILSVTEPARLQALGAGVLRIQSWKGTAFDVQSSTDLDQWSPMTTMTNLTGTLEFTDPNAANQSSRFYRTVLR